ncbi:MAG: membrane protein insertion efficiency factor YidD [Betaproteobacteria bacterium]|nr:membrane protein insertion efficiency factor YidD [Betaproteobacteria bacterium]
MSLSRAAPRPLPLARALMTAIRGYQLVLSPYLGSQCRFLPTCSSYAMEAIRSHGSARGIWLGVRRLGRCHPWCAGGWDPVPPVRNIS